MKKHNFLQNELPNLKKYLHLVTYFSELICCICYAFWMDEAQKNLRCLAIKFKKKVDLRVIMLLIWRQHFG